MKNIDEVANAIVALQVNAEEDWEKIFVKEFRDKLLEFSAGKPKICPVCGKPFLPRHINTRQKYCSTSCAYSAENKKRYARRKCVICGKSFYYRKGNPTKTCSTKCSRTLFHATISNKNA